MTNTCHVSIMGGMEKFFGLKARGTSVSREVVAGITTFLAMAYILAVNPAILSETGMKYGSVFTATAISSAIATLVMAFTANLPVALAPGMGLNAFFTFSVCLGMKCSWQFALTAVLVEGIIFIVLSVVGIRETIIRSIPKTLREAVAVGIGLFIALIGLNNAGIVNGTSGTIIAFSTLNMSNACALVAVIGLVITIVLYIKKVPGAVLLGIALTTIIGIPFGVTHVPEGFKPLSLPSAPYVCEFTMSGVISLKFFVVLFTFLFTDLFDTVGTLMGVTEQAGLTDKDGNIPNVKNAFLSDAVGTVVGAALGTSTVTSFVESSAGVAAGGKTGLTSVATAVMFLLALFFTPIFGLIPAAATAPALIFVGFLMMSSVMSINFKDLSEGIPAFITIMTMPFAYSISKGIAFGVMSYVIAKCAANKTRDVPPFTWGLAVVFLADMIFEAMKG